MTWQSGQRIVAEATGATVSGTGVAADAQVHVDELSTVLRELLEAAESK